MRLVGQRWHYRIGNSQVDVDHAFAHTLWAQERLRINGQTLFVGGGRWRLFKLWNQPWMTPLDEGLLSVTLRSKLLGMACCVELEGREVEPEALFEATWRAAPHDWPGESRWVECHHATWVAR